MNKKIKVLIVEDDEAILKLYNTKLTHCGFDVLVARDGKEGVEKAKSMVPDIILLDVMMPIMNGFEALKALKKDKETASIPVVILSNYGELPNVTEGFNMGADDYLIKAEHTPEEILETVKDVLKDKSPIIGKAFKETC